MFQVTNVPTAEMHGSSIAEIELPVIGVNIKDKPNGRIFSLLHEFTHLMLGRSGLCDFDEDFLRSDQDQSIEVFCNRVAAAALVPKEHFLSEPTLSAKRLRATDWSSQDIDTLSRRYSVSQEVILRRLLTLGYTTQAFYREKRQEFLAIYKQLQRRERESQKGREIRRNLPREAVSNYGQPFIRLVLDNYYQEHISLSDVSRYLGIRAKQLPRVEDMMRA